ncbi:MAG: LysM peptidoglycan-binding domain-containing protein [Patescibacteria group bacterium]|jgi:LysM repeat protein
MDRTRKICIGILVLLGWCLAVQIWESVSSWNFFAESPTFNEPVVAAGEIKLTTPAVVVPQTQGARMIKHRVMLGETLTFLAERYNTTVEAIQEENHPWADRPRNILTGWPLFIRTSVQDLGDAKVVTLQSFDYEVKPGDNPTSIAREFKTTVSAIEDLNPGKDFSVIRVGDKIKITGLR